MKKFLAIVAIDSFAVACNNSSESKPAADSPAAPVVDTAAKAIDTAAKAVDTAVKAVVDTAAKK